MKRRLQFSVATLLAIVTVSAFAAHWYATRHRVALAQEELGSLMAGRDVGVAGDDELYDASVKLLYAEQAVPFSNGRDACARHLELMERLENDWRNLPLTAVGGGDPVDFQKECDEKADRIHVWVEEAQRWLADAK